MCCALFFMAIDEDVVGNIVGDVLVVLLMQGGCCRPSLPPLSRGGCCKGNRVSHWLRSGLPSVVLDHGTGSWYRTMACWAPLRGGWPLWPPVLRKGPGIFLVGPGSGWHGVMLSWCPNAVVVEVVGGKCGLVHHPFVGSVSVAVVLEGGDGRGPRRGC